MTFDRDITEGPEPRRRKREIGWGKGDTIDEEWLDWSFSLDDREMRDFFKGGEVNCRALFYNGDTTLDPGDYVVLDVDVDCIKTDWDALTQSQRDAIIREAQRRGAGDCVNE